ncbi:MAG: putative toxin-antitoxin system toxin component, PIN family [Chloroflexi bacterium]|nr:putative toxin-antitoxin system toxin component, PIN family [Chloroflexota bacterium]
MRGVATGARPWVVLDSNVLISGFAFPGGVPYRILQVLVRGEILVAISPFVLAEVEDVLRDKLRVSEETLHEALSFLRDHCRLVDPPAAASTPDLSPADNQVLDCAVASQAHYLVTGDKGIQRLGEFQGTSIVSPSEFLEVVLRNRGEF